MGLLTGDTYITNKETEHVHHYDTVNITEKRAPTDLSVKLLNEFEEKAKNNIIAKIEIRENNVDAAAIYFHDDFCGDRVQFHIRFKMNGKEYVMRDSVDSFEWNREISQTYNGFGNVDVFKAFHNKVGEIIAFELMKECKDFCDSVAKKSLNYR